MDPKIAEVSQVFERFKAAFVRKDFGTCTTLLSSSGRLPPSPQESPVLGLNLLATACAKQNC